MCLLAPRSQSWPLIPWEAIICLTFWRHRTAGNLRHGAVAQSLSRVQRCVTWASAHQAPLSSAVSQGLLEPLPLESVTPSHRLILCCPLPLLFSIFPSIGVFSNESALEDNECAAQILAREQQPHVGWRTTTGNLCKHLRSSLSGTLGAGGSYQLGFWADISGLRLPASVTWVWEVTAYPSSLFLPLIKSLTSVNHSSSVFRRGSLPNFLGQGNWNRSYL